MARKSDLVKFKPLEQKFLLFRWGLLGIAFIEYIIYPGAILPGLFYLGFILALAYNLLISAIITSKNSRVNKFLLFSVYFDLPVYTLLLAGSANSLNILFVSYFLFITYHGTKNGIRGLVITAAESLASLIITTFIIREMLISKSSFLIQVLILVFGVLIVREIILMFNLSQFQYKKAQAQAAQDPLTGLPNRLLLEQNYTKAVMNYKRTRLPFAIAIFDIDNFKKINDQRGHVFGDKVLVILARVLKTNVRKNDFICRYGGEEFLVIFNGCRLEDACLKTDQLREEFACNYFEKPITVSAGVSFYQEGCSMAENIDIADKALYAAKESGKNRTMSSNNSGFNLFRKDA